MTVPTRHAQATGGVCQARACVSVDGVAWIAIVGTMQLSSACQTAITMATLTWRATSVCVTQNGQDQSAAHVSVISLVHKI